MLRTLKTLRYLLRVARTFPFDQPWAERFVQKFPDLSGRAVVREQFLEELAAGRRVLHFGFLDAPFMEDKVARGDLVHARLRRVAARVYGVDIDAEALERYRAATGDADNGIADVGDSAATAQLPQGFDLVLFPEVLEHVQNPGLVLSHLRDLCLRNGGATLCVTTPNAFNAPWFMSALGGREIVHPEHYYYFSPYTLRRLLESVGFTDVRIGMYGPPELVNPQGITGYGLTALCVPVPR